MSLIPPIGAAGLYQLSAPYAVLLIENTTYSCQAVRKIADVINNGFDPFEVYYEPHGISRTVYNTHVAQGVCIVGLVSAGGAWVYVPSAYILSYPNMGGIAYTSLVLGVDLGPIPEYLNLSAIRQKVIDVVRDYIGITSTVTTVAVSETQLISHDNHNAIEVARLALIDSSNTDHSRYLAEKARADALQAKVTELEAWIITNLPPTP